MAVTIRLERQLGKTFPSLVLIMAVAFAGIAVSAAQSPKKKFESTKRMAFEVVSIRPSKPGGPPEFTVNILPDGYRATDQSMFMTILMAYFPHPETWSDATRITNQPKWIGDQYDIQAKVAPTDIAQWQNQGPGREVLRAMLRTMLEDRFKLLAHMVPTQSSGYALVAAKNGPKMAKSNPSEPPPPNGIPLTIGDVRDPEARMLGFRKGDQGTALSFYHMTMPVLAEWLSGNMRAPIQDETGLSGRYDFVLHKSPPLQGGMAVDPGPSLDWDIGELGLKLVQVKLPSEKLVIDHIERPSPN